MNTTTIVSILAAVVVTSIVFIGIRQMRRRARIERLRKTTANENTYNHALGLLSDIPGQYLNAELKLLLVNQMEYASRQLTRLRADLPAQNWLESCQQTKQQILDNGDDRKPVKIDSPERAGEVKGRLQSLATLIEGMHKDGKIDSATARKNLKYLRFLAHKTDADMHVFQAREYVKQNRIQKAIQAYHLASTELGKSRDNPIALRAIKSFRTRIRELEALNVDGKETASTGLQARRDRESGQPLHKEERMTKRADNDS
ncbi:hypothetical protein QVZ43_12305 [Marinobacter sp. chi1]|uniref:DNA topoisomerase I n=1 Tax=Marinobacter suaedae TaxID=3057675 RepID=A0ABT8W2N2_9GAMM|nr:hypothetical protein [Marinobacter sp. chi1]MDO3722504.1 hypothetical protein [Marinobacter sp. chi1]